MKNLLRNYLVNSIEKSAEQLPLDHSRKTMPDGAQIKTERDDMHVSIETVSAKHDERQSLVVYSEDSKMNGQITYIRMYEGARIKEIKGKRTELSLGKLARVAYMMSNASRDINLDDSIYSF